MKVRIKKIDRDLPDPLVAYPGDAGLDLVARSGGLLQPGERQLVQVGIAVEVPEGYVGLVCPRSGLAKQHVSVTNAPGVLDSGYRDELRVWVEHRGHRGHPPFQFYRGDRIAQLVIVPFLAVEPEFVDELSPADRGLSGFGSSGVKTVVVSQQVGTVEAGASVTGVEIDSLGAAKGKKKK